jgi:hypothetical protein
VTTRDILKMESCSKGWCVYIASGRTRRGALFERILRAFGAPVNPRPDVRRIRGKLEELGRAFYYESFLVTETQNKTAVELAEEVARRLEASGKRADRPRILTTILTVYGYTRADSVIECPLSADMGILTWRADGGESQESDHYEIRTGSDPARVTNLAQVNAFSSSRGTSNG